MGLEICKEKCYNKKISDSNNFPIQNQNIFDSFLNNDYLFDKNFNNNNNNNNFDAGNIKFFIDSFNNDNNKNDNILNYVKKVELIQKKFREFLSRKNFNNNNNKNQIEIKDFNDNNNNNNNETESTLFFNREQTKNSFLSNNPKSIPFPNEKFPHFNLLSKQKIRYKYYGYLTKANKKKIKNGFGKILFSDKSSFVAFFNNNLANGICSYFDNKNGNYVGEYVKSIPKGFGIFSSNSVKITGNFDSNNFSGIVEETNSFNSSSIDAGNYVFNGSYRSSKKNGIGSFIWADGTIYEGEFVENEMTGFCIITYPNNNKFKGQILNSEMNGYGEFYFNNGKKYFGFYKKDKRDGFGLFVWNEKVLEAFVGFWAKGNQCGPGIKIKGEQFRYGIWNKNKEIWVKGPWEFQKHLKNKNLKYLKFFNMKQNQILKFIFKLIEIPFDEI